MMRLAQTGELEQLKAAIQSATAQAEINKVEAAGMCHAKKLAPTHRLGMRGRA